MQVIWYPLALADMNALRAYLADVNPQAATRTLDRIFEAAASLARHPHIGRPGRIAGTRELVVTGTSYVLPYQVRQDHVAILRVYHGARRWPDSL